MSSIDENVFCSYFIEDGGEDFDAIMEIYERLFPPAEKIPHEILLHTAQQDFAQLKVYKEGETICGFSFIVKDENLTYLWFLAVNDSIQSKGYGSKILQLLKEEHSDKPFVLSIEDPSEEGAENTSQRMRRQAFYEKNGFVVTGVRLISSETKFLVMGTTKDIESVFKNSVSLMDFFANNGFEVVF